MKLLFVKADKVGSLLLRIGLGEKVSHVVIEFNGKYHQYFHSYGKGLQAMTPDEYKAMKYTVVKEIEFKLIREDEYMCQDLFYNRHRNVRYDWPAFAYFTWRVLLRRLFGVEYPKRNLWAKAEMNLCTEAVYLAAEVYAEVIGYQFIPSDVDLAMITPETAYYKINQHAKELDLV